MKKLPKIIYLKHSVEERVDGILGAMFWLTVYGGFGFILFKRFGLAKEIGWLCFSLLLASVIYAYWKGTKYDTIETNLSEKDNLNLLRGTFNKLGWSTQENDQEIIIWHEENLFKFINGQVVYSDNYIGFNFRYKSNRKFGRPPFFIGLRTYLKWKFKTQLKEMLKELSDGPSSHLQYPIGRSSRPCWCSSP